MATLQLVTSEPGGTVYSLESRTAVSTGSGGLLVTSGTRLCTAPCTVQMRTGNYTLGLRRSSDTDPTFAKEPLVITGDAEIRASYVDRSALRWGLFVGGLVAMGAGAYVYATSKKENCSIGPGYCYSEHDGSNDGLALVLFGGGLVAMTTAGWFRNYATFEVVNRGQSRGAPVRATARVSPFWHTGEARSMLSAAGLPLAPTGLAMTTIF